MKEKELYVEYTPQQHVYYVEKEDEIYGPVLSGSYISKHHLDDYWNKRKNLEMKLRKQLHSGEISTVYYYMVLQEMGEADLASRVGISRHKLHKHFKPAYFNRIKIKTLKKYAEVFNVPLVNMFQTLLIKNGDEKKINVDQIKTNNPLHLVTKIGLNK